MTYHNIDLYSLPFWIVVTAAILMMSPLATPRARKNTFALVNIGFLAFFLNAGVLPVIAGVVLAWLVLRFARQRWPGVVLFPVGAATVTLIFLVHKLPQLPWGVEIAVLNPILTTIGFSYVALRLVEVARSVREGRHAPPSLASTLNYLLPFHMLAAGPIQSYDEFVGQPGVPPALGIAEALAAVERIAWGLFKKYVLSNLLQQLFLTGFRAGGPYFLFELQANALWVYLDFSAYSDIAIGVGRLIGIATPENFSNPFLARNIIEFWERWHMSLSLFIRRNIFIPIQLSLMRRTDGRAPLVVASLAFTVSFVLCGLWHGLSERWLVWGIFQASGLIVCNVYKSVLRKRLGRVGLDRYLANRWIHLMAVILTFEFVATSTALATCSFEDLSWLMNSTLELNSFHSR